MDGGGTPRTPEDVFRDFRARRAGMIKALTTDVEKFYQQCDPEKENLCLYGLPNETWEVNLPAEEVPPELPEPALGINFARDGMDEKDWLSLVAVHSDAWLLAVAFYFGARFGFDKESSQEYAHIWGISNFLLLIAQSGTAKKQTKEKTPKSSSKSNKSGTKPPRQPEPNSRGSKMPPPKDEDDSGGEEDEEEEDHENTLCGSCGDNYGQDEFWICCDACETWFHGKCVKITPAKAEHIKHYKCPNCSGSGKRARA
ncbi:hypothetical protein PVAP13_8NG196400 [Panicum virgatum]|uniref:PHD finger protein ALFIN-LIKE n=1 Tax=Panicum virgatum TaxID=38727 RepID=A0A8T0P761_PANVG|nr:hypothetical protein PVAP13_8NG196400 [Panicum virgatum]